MDATERIALNGQVQKAVASFKRGESGAFTAGWTKGAGKSQTRGNYPWRVTVEAQGVFVRFNDD